MITILTLGHFNWSTTDRGLPFSKYSNLLFSSSSLRMRHVDKLDERDHDALSGRGVEHRDVAAAPWGLGRQGGRHSRARAVTVRPCAEAMVRVGRADAREPGHRL